MTGQHRLAAIMFSDIVGYTALMGKNEAQAFDVLRKNKSIHKSLIKKYNGAFLKEMGDGILASFPSATNAVLCAVEIQRTSKKENISLRIGVHEGEVVFEGNDVLGDGVNVASRLQESAEPGCIYLSGALYQNIKNKPELEAEFVEERAFKNVSDPVPVYNVVYRDAGTNSEGVDIPVYTPKVDNGLKVKKWLLLSALILIVIVIGVYIILKLYQPTGSKTELEKSIAVLPLRYLSEDRSKRYLADGVTAAITGHLSNIEGLRVMSETSVKQYRETTKPAKAIGEELDVSYLIEGSFLMMNDSVKLIIQLIVAEKGDHLLYREYDRNYKDIFKVQSEVAQAIAKEVEIMISPEVKKRIESDPTDNIEAYKLYLQGRYLWTQEGRDNLDKSITYYKQALKIDQDFALAYAGMAVTYNSFGWYGYLPNREAIPQAREAAMKALEIDNTLGEAHTELAFTKLLLDWDWSGSEREFKQALELNPNEARTHNLYAWLLSDIGRHDEAIEQSKQAYELDPLSVINWVNLGRHYYFKRDYDRAIEEYRKVIDLFPNNKYSPVSWYPRSYLALALLQKGLYHEAIEEYLKADYEHSWYCFLGYTYGVTGKREKALEILNHYLELSKKEYIWNANVAIIYLGLGEKDKAFEWFEKSYEQREGWMTMLKVEPFFDSLRSDPRFQDLLERMNFPE